jgi:copper chaperone
MRKATLHITGMSCGHCLNAVTQALNSLPGIRVESVQMGRAVVSYDEATVKSETIENAIADAGYTATAA